MKHVLFLRFLVLFNVWWISWNVFVHATDKPDSLSPKTSSSGLHDSGELRTTISEHPSSYTSQSSEEVTSTKLIDTANKTKGITSERRLSGASGNEREHSSVTTQQQVNGESVTKTDDEGKNTIESSNSQSVEHYVEVTTASYSLNSEQSDQTGITTEYVSKTNLQETSTKEAVTEQATRATSESEGTTVTTADQANTSTVSTEFMAQTSLPHFQSTTMPLLFEDPVAPTDITSLNVTNTSVTLQWFQAGLATNFSVTVEGEGLYMQLYPEPPCLVEISIETNSTSRRFCNWTWVSFVIPDLPKAGATYNSTILACISDRCANASHAFQTAPADPDNIAFEVGTQSVNVSWSQKGVANNFSILVSDPSATVRCNFDNKPNVLVFIDQLSTPGQLLTITITALSGQLMSNSRTEHVNTNPVAPANITSVNITKTSVTLQWFQAGLATNFSVTVEGTESYKKQLYPEPPCLGEISSETNSTNRKLCNWTWVSFVIPDLPKAGATYNSTIVACVSDRCANASHAFQTAPADPGEIKPVIGPQSVPVIGTQSVNVSWSQKGVANNFSILVSDPSARVNWTSDNKMPEQHVWAFIDQLSTPGQLLAITITALSGQLKSNSRTVRFNTKPSKPGSLVISDCNDKNLCIQWEQPGIFDSYIISVNGSEATVLCSNSSDATKNLTTVNCIVQHVVPSGSSTTLSVAVESGPQKSDEMTDVFVKQPAKPESLRVVTANTSTSTVCFSWNQTGFYDEFNIEISQSNYTYKKNLTILKDNVTRMSSDDQMLMWCINDLPCPGAAYSLLVSTVSHRKKSDFQNLPFRSAVDSPLVTCVSQTNKSFHLSIGPDVKNDSCPSVEDIVRFEYTYQPLNIESCSNPNERNHVLNGTRDTNVTELIAGVTYQVKVLAVIDNIRSKEQVINCTTKPNPPSGLQILNVSSTDVMLIWTPPEGCVADFLVQCIGQNNAMNDSKNVTEANATCGNLTPGALYNVTVSSRLGDNTGIPASKAKPLPFVTEPAKPEGLRVLMDNTSASTVCFSWNQTGFYDEFNIEISLSNHSYQRNLTILKDNVTRMSSDGLMLMWCISDLPCPGAAYSLLVATVSHGKRSDFQNLSFRSAVDSPLVMCVSQTNESLEIFIRPDIKNDSCPSLEDAVRFKYTYQPVNIESCSNPMEKTPVLNGTHITNISGLTAGVMYQVKIWAVIEDVRSKEQVINCTTNPNPPSGIHIVHLSATDVKLNWTLPEGCVADFLVQCIGQNNASSDSKNVTEALVVCENLTPGANYTVRVSSRMGDNTGIAPSKAEPLWFVTEPAKPEGLHVLMANTSASMVCFSWNQTDFYDEFDIQISLSNHGYKENLTIPKNNVTHMSSDGLMLMWCINNLPCAGAVYSLLVATVSHEKRSDFQNLSFHSAVDSVVTCVSQTNNSFQLSIGPDIKNDSCPNLENIVRFEYTYQPMNNESCSYAVKKNSSLKGTSNTDVTGLTAGVTYQVKVWAFIHSIRSKEQVINCTTNPNPPSGLHIVNLSSTDVILNWTPPEGCVADFLVQCIGHNNAKNDSKHVTEAHVACGNLTPGTNYTVTVSSRLGENTGIPPSKSEPFWFVTEPAKPEGLHVVTANTSASTVCFLWNQTGFYDEFNIEISLSNHSYQRNLTILKDNVTHMSSDGVMLIWCISDLPCPGAVYSLLVATVSLGKRSDFQNLSFRSAMDSPLVKCVSQTNESFKLSIQPDIKNDSCPSFKDTVRFEYTYQPVNIESCSNQMETNLVLNGTQMTDVTGLTAGVMYQVKIWAVIDDVRSKEQVINCTTNPNPPSGLHILKVSSTDVKLNWTLPKGCVADFLVQCIGQNSAMNDSKNVKEANVACENLTPGALYNVTVSSRLRNNTGIPPSKAKPLKFVTVPMSPYAVRVEGNLVNSLQLSVQYNTTWQCTHFHFEGVGINATNLCTIQTHNLSSLKSNMCYNISVYTISNYSGHDVESRTSVDSKFVSDWTLPLAVSNLSITSPTVNSLTLNWIQPDDSIIGIHGYNLSLENSTDYQQNITLHCNSTVFNCTKTMTYELVNLTPSTNYTITIWAVNMGGDSDKQVITEQTRDLPVYPFPKMVVAIVACAMVALVLTVVILFFVLRTKTKFAVPSSRRPSDGLGFRNPTFAPDDGESMKPKPIPLDKFIEHLETLHDDSDYLFSTEYALLTELSPKLPQTAAELEENRTKNRYSNILPFDNSRVKLIPLDDDDQGSDYINASYMPGFLSKREFIAAQGPMKSTVDDFWRMIWEQHISTIVMVTNLQERGREKCAEYWPTDEEPVFYGDLQVQMKSESQLNYYIIRILDVKLGEKKRVVKHLHFISWPDFGCPENTAVLLDFVLGVRAHAPSQPLQGCGPILVHCSAGVGRTGTFILVDHLLQRMRTHKVLDIFGLVLDMRSYRCNMLQTEAQYVFAHECIKTAIERQMISSARSSTAEGEDDECMYQNVSRKDKLPEEEECVYQNCTKTNLGSPPV